MSVRVATVADLEWIVPLEREVAEAPHWGVEAYVGALAGEQTGAVRRRVFVWGDEQSGFAVGMVVSAGGETFGELESVVVGVGARRRGIGRGLCGAVVRWCREEGAGEIGLEVRASSAGAIALYRGLGFREAGLRRGYYSGGAEDGIVLRLGLGGGGS